MADYRLGRQNSRSEYYPKFSETEFDRRRENVREMMDERDLDALLLYGDRGFHADPIDYLANYRPPFATYLAFFADPDEDSTLFVGVSNHLQYVREASVIEDLRPMLPDPARSVAERLREAGVGDGRVGVVGSDPRYDLWLPHRHVETFENELDGALVDATEAYTRLIAVAGDEELDLIERSASLLDDAMRAFEDAVEPGVTEQELKGVLQETVGKAGGGLGASFISSGPMEGAEPGAVLPWKQPSSREIETGDVVNTEISAGYRGYKTQIHRPYAVGEAPTATYEDIYDVTREAYEGVIDALQPGNGAEDVYDALAPIERSEYKIYDVAVHGYGGGYRHPFVGVENSNYWPGIEDPLTEAWTFEPGNVIVVQPTAVTEDERAGIQFGTTVVVREDGPEVLQEYPAEFVTA